MNSDLDKFLDQIDEWKFKLHEQLRGMTPAQRKAFWSQIHKEAQERGLPVAEQEKQGLRYETRKAGPIS